MGCESFLEGSHGDRAYVASDEAGHRGLHHSRGHYYTGFVDLLWPGYIGVEHKSAGQDLTAAMAQLVDYLPGVADIDLPQLLVVCDFATFVVRDLDTDTEVSFPLAELPQRIEMFAFLAGYDRTPAATIDGEQANFKATELLAQVHDALEAIGYPDHQVRVLLVRLLYVLFADDTGVWSSNLFEDYINVHTAADGSASLRQPRGPPRRSS